MTPEKAAVTLCTVPGHAKCGETVWVCEQYVRQTEQAGGTGQWLVSVKQDHEHMAAQSAL